MKNRISFLLIVLLASVTGFCQVVTKVQTDSLRVFQIAGHPAELIIENSSKAKTGAALKNKGNGRTEFDYVVDSVYQNDSMLVVKRGPVTSQFNIRAIADKGIDSIRISNDSFFYYKNGIPRFGGKGTSTSGTVTVKAFATINALKTSTFHTTVGDLKADILDGGRSFKWNGESTASDDGGVTTIVPTTGVGAWERIFTGSIRAAEVGIRSDGTDQTTLLNSLFTLSTVKQVLFDNGDVTISGVFDANSKSVVFANGARFKGSGSVINLKISHADYDRQIFDTTLNTNGGILAPDILSPKMWGAAADFTIGTAYGSQSPTDNWKAFDRATRAIKNKASYFQYNIGASVYIPSTPSGKAYYLRTTWTLDRKISVFGDAAETTSIMFPHGVVGIWLKSANGADTSVHGGFNSLLRDITIYGNYSNQEWTFDDNISHGVLVQQNKSELTRVTVNGFGSNGIYVYAFVPNHNANNCFINDCVGYYNGGYGLKFESTDANQCLINKGDYSLNVRGGVYDNSFLGCFGKAIHTATNVVQSTLNKSCAHYGGHRWICKVDGTVGVTPGTDATKWQDMGVNTSDAAYTTYDNTKTYYYGGAYRFGDFNQGGTWQDLYAETDQWAGTPLGSNAIIVGQIGILMEGYSLRKNGGVLTTPRFSIEEKLKINATAFGNGAAVINGSISGAEGLVALNNKATGGTFYGQLEMQAPNMTNGEETFVALGKEQASLNRGYLSYHYTGNGSTSNYLSNGFYGGSDVVRYYADGSVVLPNYVSGTIPTGTAAYILGLTSTGKLIGSTPVTGGGSGVTTVGTFITTPGTAKGMSIQGDSIMLHAATPTTPGAVTEGIQEFGGTKTFSAILLGNSAAYDGSGASGGFVNIYAPSYSRLYYQNSAAGTASTDGTQTGINLSGSDVDYYILQREAANIVFGTGATARWKIDANGHLIAATDNSYDIGTSGARPRNLSIAGNITASGLGTTGNRLVARNSSSELYDTGIDPATLSGGGGSNSVITNLGTGDTLAVPVGLDTIGIKSLNVHSSDATVNVIKTVTGTDVDYNIKVAALTSGTYQPTLTNGSNISSSTTYTTVMYSRVGSVVTVSGLITITPTASGAVSWDLSLPISTSNFTSNGHAAGVGQYINGTSLATARIYANLSAQTVKFHYRAPDTAVADLSFTFQYTIQ